jgi:GntR family transcriptional regulator
MSIPPLHVNPSGDAPIFRQIMRQITDAVAGGKARPGERLPSHRELAAQLVIAPLTVKKAYDELERKGLITTVRGKGTFVADSLPVPSAREKRERLRGAAQQLLSQAALIGVPFGEIVELLEELQRRMKP